MSKLNVEFLQTGGVPLTNDLMNVLQEAYRTYEVLGDIAGDKTILQGCEINGSIINPGIVAIDGEVLPFEGGLLTSTVYIQLEQFTEVFQDQTSNILVRKKTVKFGTSSTVYNWSSFRRLDTLKKMQDDIVQKANQSDLNDVIQRLEVVELKTAPIINGGIAWAWFKPVSEIPVGWKECLNIRGKTIVGLDPNDSTFSTLGANIGEKTHTLTISEMPKVKPRIPVRIAGGGWRSSGGSGRPISDVGYLNPNAGGDPVQTAEGQEIGGGLAHNNIQPSTIAYFIEPNFQ